MFRLSTHYRAMQPCNNWNGVVLKSASKSRFEPTIITSPPSAVVTNMIIIIVISADAPCRARTRNLFAKPSTTHDRASVATFRFRYDHNRQRRFSHRILFPSSNPISSIYIYLMALDKKRSVMRGNNFRVDLAHVELRPGIQINSN